MADAATAQVNIAANDWKVSGLTFGGSARCLRSLHGGSSSTRWATHAVFTGSGTISVVDPTLVTMDVLGSPSGLGQRPISGTTTSCRRPGLITLFRIRAISGAKRGSTTFEGDTLTVEAGGRFQFRGKDELDETTTVYNLYATGGTSGMPTRLWRQAPGQIPPIISTAHWRMMVSRSSRAMAMAAVCAMSAFRQPSAVTAHCAATGSAAHPHTCTIVNVEQHILPECGKATLERSSFPKR